MKYTGLCPTLPEEVTDFSEALGFAGEDGKQKNKALQSQKLCLKIFPKRLIKRDNAKKKQKKNIGWVHNLTRDETIIATFRTRRRTCLKVKFL